MMFVFPHHFFKERHDRIAKLQFGSSELVVWRFEAFDGMGFGAFQKVWFGRRYISLKLTCPVKIANLPTIHFQVRAVSFREGMILANLDLMKVKIQDTGI